MVAQCAFWCSPKHRGAPIASTAPPAATPLMDARPRCRDTSLYTPSRPSSFSLIPAMFALTPSRCSPGTPCSLAQCQELLLPTCHRSLMHAWPLSRPALASTCRWTRFSSLCCPESTRHAPARLAISTASMRLYCPRRRVLLLLAMIPHRDSFSAGTSTWPRCLRRPFPCACMYPSGAGVSDVPRR